MRDNIKNIPSGGMSVNKRQCVRHCSADDPKPTSISFSPAILQVGSYDRVLANESEPKNAGEGF